MYHYLMEVKLVLDSSCNNTRLWVFKIRIPINRYFLMIPSKIVLCQLIIKRLKDAKTDKNCDNNFISISP